MALIPFSFLTSLMRVSIFIIFKTQKTPIAYKSYDENAGCGNFLFY